MNPPLRSKEDREALLEGLLDGTIDCIVTDHAPLPGIPNIAESVQIARDVLLAEATGCHYHVCHVSTKESVRVIRDAKKAGIHVTAEVTPHHLLLTENDVLDGTIDCIVTDHAPHAKKKNQPMTQAPFGIVGSETAFPLLYTHFVRRGNWSLQQLVDYFN